MNKWFVLGFLLFAVPGAAQPSASGTPGTRRAPDPFWPRDPRRHTVSFGGHSHLRGETPAESAQHLRRWLTAYFTDWAEYNSGDPAKLLFSARMRGLHAGVELRCAVGAKLEAGGFRFLLSQFTVGAPNGQGTVFWHPLHQLLDDPDFRPDLAHFQQELEQALPAL